MYVDTQNTRLLTLIVPALMVCDSFDRVRVESSVEFLAQVFRSRSMSRSLNVNSLKLTRDRDARVLKSISETDEKDTGEEAGGGRGAAEEPYGYVCTCLRHSRTSYSRLPSCR